MNPEEFIIGQDYSTRDGKKVRIYGIDLVGDFPILGVSSEQNRSDTRTFLPDGRWSKKYECAADLICLWENREK